MIIFEPRDDYPELISDLNYRDTLYNYVTGEKIGEYLGYRVGAESLGVQPEV
jgi:hypothetical protein